MTTYDAGQLEALRAAVDQGTFDAAARALHVTPSAVSQRIKALETVVGRVLVTRTKPVLPTPAGTVLLRLARQVAAVTEEAVQEIGTDSAARVTVPLAVNADSLATWLLPALATVTPPLLYDLRCHSEDATIELLRQGTVMAAVTVRAAAISGCSSVRLGDMRYVAVATPAFIERWFAQGLTARSLAQAPVVTYDQHDDLHERFVRRRTRQFQPPPTHHVPGATDILLAVRLGLGWGVVPELQVRHDLGGPHLRALDPDAPVDIPLFWQQWRIPSRGLAAIESAVRAGSAEALRGAPG